MKEFKRFVIIYLNSFSFVYVFCSVVLLVWANVLMSGYGIGAIGCCVIILLIVFAHSFIFIALVKTDNVFRQIELELKIEKIKEKLENEENMEFNEQNKF